MITEAGFPPSTHNIWTSAWALYLGLHTFADYNSCDSISIFKQKRQCKWSYIDPYLAVTVMMIGMVAFVAQKLVRENIEPHPGPYDLE